MKIHHFPVMITQDSDGAYIARVPELPGCHTQAKSLDVLYDRVKEAIELYLEVHQERKSLISQDKFTGVQQVEIHV
jgi:predicted RNase H-like HicB family nuclease